MLQTWLVADLLSKVSGVTSSSRQFYTDFEDSLS